ncbi:hypothetical protein [Klebsiella oxytoca]|uniref:hypothetical protein n=1 Tax=Klebsiella oxytoca TaxID=571 RepID=UPI003D9F3551
MKKLNALVGQGFDHSENSLIDNSVPKMSSLQMVEYINADRKAKAEAEGLTFPCKEYRVLQHKDFLKKTPKVLGEEHSAKFFAQYKDSTGRYLPCYQFPKQNLSQLPLNFGGGTSGDK